MKSTFPLAAIASIALLATAAAATSVRAKSDDRAHERVMQTVPNTASTGEPGEGWRYFSDPGAHRAVVIGPQGEYFYSRGKGLRQVLPVQGEAADRADAGGMQAVTHAAAAGEPGNGWRYFSDASEGRAVVISPLGDYYLSRGKGLRWVATAQTNA